MKGVSVRWMIRRDLDTGEVLAIEKDCFQFAWDREEFIRALRQRECIGMVAEVNDEIVGYMIYELHKNRIHVINFAVAPKYQRSGVGSQMVAKLVYKLNYQRRNRIALEVRETNLAALNFFKACGFQAAALLRGFYEDSPEDAITMVYRVGAESSCDALSRCGGD
jgi:ribosomal-protein-alanine N-acetyltransferase